jgi:hypothetical protein
VPFPAGLGAHRGRGGYRSPAGRRTGDTGRPFAGTTPLALSVSAVFALSASAFYAVDDVRQVSVPSDTRVRVRCGCGDRTLCSSDQRWVPVSLMPLLERQAALSMAVPMQPPVRPRLPCASHGCSIPLAASVRHEREVAAGCARFAFSGWPSTRICKTGNVDEAGGRRSRAHDGGVGRYL